MKPFDPSKPVQLRDGTPARIIATDLKGYYPIAVAVTYDDVEEVSVRSAGGKEVYGEVDYESRLDLVNIPARIKRDVWINVYDSGECCHGTRADADDNASSTRIACVKVTIDCEEGEGL